MTSLPDAARDRGRGPVPGPAPQGVLVVGFGGPEKREDVVPFLENVLRGKRVPRERMLEVAEHYYRFDGVSPINQQVRDLVEAFEPELRRRGIDLPVFQGNRNWHPLLPDVLRQMGDSGVRHVLAVVLSAYGSYSGCRQYLENLEEARAEAGPGAPTFEKARPFYNHPGFIDANAARVKEGMVRIPRDRREKTRFVFTAHSIPRPMADTGPYEEQLLETCRLVSERLSVSERRWDLAYQSRSGRPSDPWLEPDICDHLAALRGQGVEEVIVHPIGFLSDHMEVLFDLDVEAREAADSLGLGLTRTSTVGTHPGFVRVLGDLVEERLDPGRSPEAAGRHGPAPAACAPDCCAYRSGRPTATPIRPGGA